MVSPRGMMTFLGGATAVGFLANQKTGRIAQGCCFGSNWCERCPNPLCVNPIKTSGFDLVSESIALRYSPNVCMSLYLPL